MHDRKLNVGIIGLGSISTSHLDAYQAYSRAHLYAICDNDADWLPDAAKEYNPEKSYLDYKEMLADPKLDAVSICLPTKLHAPVTIDALNAGKHVLCEKPMALNAAEAREMKKASESSGKKLMISHNQRLENNVQYIKRRADEGFFGEIYLMRIGWRRPMGSVSPYGKRPNGQTYNRNFFNEKDNGGGVLRDLGSHLLDLSLYITGFPEPTDVVSSLYRKFYANDYDPEKYLCDSEDMAVSQIVFGNGLTMQLEVSFGSYVAEGLVFTEIYGTKGGASRRNGKLKLISCEDCNMVETNIVKYDFASKCSQNRFVDAVLDDTDVPIPAGEGIKVVEVLDAIYKAAGEIKK